MGYLIYLLENVDFMFSLLHVYLYNLYNCHKLYCLMTIQFWIWIWICKLFTFRSFSHRKDCPYYHLESKMVDKSIVLSSNYFFFIKEPSLFTWDDVDGFKIYEHFSDSDKLLKIWFSLFKMFKKEDINSEFIVQQITDKL
jgi:hypothetical protein